MADSKQTHPAEKAGTVLVIEDDALGRKLVCDLLTAWGFEVFGAASAEEGLELAGRHRLSLVVTDINLPGMDGIDARRRLRSEQATAAVPVLAVTGSATAGGRRRVLETEFDGLFTKPIRVSELLAAVRRLASNRPKPT